MRIGVHVGCCLTNLNFDLPAKTVEIDKLRFSDKDLDVLVPLAMGQFGKVSTSFSLCRYHFYETLSG